MGAGLTTITTRRRHFPSGLTLVLFNSSGGIAALSRRRPASLQPPARHEGGSVTAPHSDHPRPGPLRSLLTLTGPDRGPPRSRPRPPPASFPIRGGRWGAAPGPTPGPEPGRAWRGLGRSGRRGRGALVGVGALEVAVSPRQGVPRERERCGGQCRGSGFFLWQVKASASPGALSERRSLVCSSSWHHGTFCPGNKEV